MAACLSSVRGNFSTFLSRVTIKNTQTEHNLVSRDTYIVAIYVHKKAISNFKLSGKPMNGNVFGNKTSLSR